MIKSPVRILATGLLFAAFAAATPAAQNSSGISDEALKQIGETLALKKSFNDVERKMSSNLTFANRQARGIGIGVMGRVLDMTRMSNGVVEVDIHARVSDPLLNLISTNGGVIKSHSAQFGEIRAVLPLDKIHLIAADASVRSIGEPPMKIHNTGSTTSQGFVSHRAREVVLGGINGNGVKVGVLSDSASDLGSVPTLMSSGDLGPNTTIVADLPSGGTDEGAAMMEIVQDMAPKAQLFFATADEGESSFAANISTLAADGCSIIVDDVFYFDESPFQDGVIDQAINSFVAGGGVYATSAGNSGNLDSGTSGTWEGDFSSGGTTSTDSKSTGLIHNFGTVASPQLYDVITGAGIQVVTLFWADPMGGSTNDYDLFILNSSGSTVLASSVNVQNGSQNPFEQISGNSVSAGNRVVVVLASGSPTALYVANVRGELSIATNGAIAGHSGNTNALSVAASYWDSGLKGVHSFSGTNNPVESFSSDGPRQMFFHTDGSPITPGNTLFATGGGVTVAKPDITGADGITALTHGFSPFFGTSAAAPHVAGIAALIKSAKPTLTGPQIRQIITTNVWDTMAPGFDRDSGSGLVNAAAAVAATLAAP